MPGFGNYGRTNHARIVEAIRARKPFKIGTMAGYTSSHGSGQLPAGWQLTLLDRIRNGAGFAPLYLVYSYQTPIAWTRFDGTLEVPPVRYSQTTTGHQSLCRQAARDGAWTVERAHP